MFKSDGRLSDPPEPLQLDEAAELHDAGDLAVVDVPHGRLLRGGPVHMFVLPAVAPPGLLLVPPRAGGAGPPAGDAHLPPVARSGPGT